MNTFFKLRKHWNFWMRVAVMVAIIAGLLLCQIPEQAKADVAPPLDTPVGTIGPYQYQDTMVKMVAEKVSIDVIAIESDQPADMVEIHAQFWMRNMGKETEKMQVVFPLTDINNCKVAPAFFEIDKSTFAVLVDSRSVEMNETTTPNQLGKRCNPLEWASFEVSFPSGRDTSILVEYTMKESLYVRGPWRPFYYILETGAGWYGPIGRAEIVVTLPYAATRDNVDAPPGYQIRGNEIRWIYENIEPRKQNNLLINFLKNGAWQDILETRSNLASNSNDAELWRQAAQYYDYIGTYKRHVENWQFAYHALDAYKQALLIQPDSTDIRADLDFLLLKMSYTGNNYQLSLDYPSVQFILREAFQIFALDPNIYIVWDIIDFIGWETGTNLWPPR